MTTTNFDETTAADATDDSAALTPPIVVADPDGEATARSPRRRAVLSVEHMTITAREGDGAPVVYNLSAHPMPDHVTAYAVLTGIWQLMRDHGGDLSDALEKLCAGKLPTTGRSRNPSDWRLAVANARFEAMKKAKTPITRDESMAYAMTFDVERMREAKMLPSVIKQHDKITGKVSALTAELG
jgi:hypothetical protein